jgi:bifunctional oligoribonuclease and PAP phosphatase NrnA
VTSIKELCDGLKQKQSFLLASHVIPEGDAIGSILAMESLLRRLGKKTMIICEDSFPERLSMLPQDRWNVASKVTNAPKFDALVVADCPTLERVGAVQKFLTPDTKIFNIDHHVSNVKFGHYNYIQSTAAACGEVIYEIFQQMGVSINQEEAAALYVSINTDTGSFKYSNTTVKSHQITAELIQTGIDIEQINHALHATYSLEKIQLYSILLGKIQRTPDGLIAWAGLTKGNLKETGSSYEDAEGFIDFLRYMKEVRFSFFMIEMDGQQQGNIRVSFRSMGDYDVSPLAVHFGGGGHKKAAGCVIKGDLKEVTEKILAEIKKEHKKQAEKVQS